MNIQWIKDLFRPLAVGERVRAKRDLKGFGDKAIVFKGWRGTVRARYNKYSIGIEWGLLEQGTSLLSKGKGICRPFHGWVCLEKNVRRI